MNAFEQLDDFERRLARLERIVFQTYTDVRTVAEYAYTNIRLEVGADEVKRLEGLNDLQDQEALKAGLMLHELATLKHTARTLRRQSRRDALTLVRDLIRPRRSLERQRPPERSSAGTDSLSGVSDGVPRSESLAGR